MLVQLSGDVWVDPSVVIAVDDPGNGFTRVFIQDCPPIMVPKKTVDQTMELLQQAFDLIDMPATNPGHIIMNVRASGSSLQVLCSCGTVTTSMGLGENELTVQGRHLKDVNRIPLEK
jgi:hypothetical protein